MSDEKTHWPFGGFFLKLSDEKNGTHEYEDYLKARHRAGRQGYALHHGARECARYPTGRCIG